MYKKQLLIFAHVSMVLVFALSVWAYEENFDSGRAEGWVDTSPGQSWVVDEDQYHQPDAGPVNVYACYAINDSRWTDYTFEVQINPTGNYAGVLFRVKDAGAGDTSWSSGDFLYWLIGINVAGYSILWDAPAGAAVHDANADTLNSGEWNDVKVVATGSDFVMYLNGEEQKRYTDNSGHDFGGIGLATYSAEAFFDNVKVDGPNIPGAAVSSAGKLTTMWGRLKAAR